MNLTVPLRVLVGMAFATTSLAVLTTAPMVTSPAQAAGATTSCPEAVAHRGYHSDDTSASENSAVAFNRAIAAGYSVETDIWRDGDGVLWFYHDKDVSRATVDANGNPGQGDIEDLSTAYLESLHYAKGGQPLLKFTDGMQILASAPTTRAYLEVKDDGIAQRVVSGVLGLSSDNGQTPGTGVDRSDTTWFTSRGPEIKSAFRAVAPSGHAAPNLQLKASTPPSVTSLENQGIGMVMLNPDILTTDLVDQYHQGTVNGHMIEVQGKTSDKPNQWAETIAAGADGQLTDFPEQFVNTCTTGGPAPEFDNMTPGSGPVGTMVTLTGSYLALDGTPTVTFEGVAAPVISVSEDDEDESADSTVVVSVPDGAPEYSDVALTTPYGTATYASQFHVTAVGTGTTGTGTTTTGKTTTTTSLGAAPETSLNAGPQGWITSRKATFHFTSSLPKSTFACTVDGKAKACTAPTLKLKRLSTGAHTVAFTAISRTGVADATPITRTFGVPKDDSWFTKSGSWTTMKNNHAYGKSFLQTRSAGAALSGKVRKAREIVLLIRRGPGFGDLKVYVGNKLVDTVHTAGKSGVRFVRIHGFKKATGTLRIVSVSDQPVRIDAIGISKSKL